MYKLVKCRITSTIQCDSHSANSWQSRRQRHARQSPRTLAGACSQPQFVTAVRSATRSLSMAASTAAKITLVVRPAAPNSLRPQEWPILSIARHRLAVTGHARLTTPRSPCSLVHDCARSQNSPVCPFGARAHIAAAEVSHRAFPLALVTDPVGDSRSRPLHPVRGRPVQDRAREQ